MHSITTSIPSSTGVELAATIDLPNVTPKAYAVFAHCLAGSRHTPAASRISKRLANHGIATVRFDFPGLGQSAGEFAETTFSSNVDDIRSVCSWLNQTYNAPQLLMGHSLGGAAALKAASQIPSLKAVATIGAPFDPAQSVHSYADRVSEVDEKGAVSIVLGGKPITISRDYLLDLADTDPVEYLSQLELPLLLLHSPTDESVKISDAIKIMQVTSYPKSLVSLDNADHLLTKKGAAQHAADIIAQWAEQYLANEAAVEMVMAGSVVSHCSPGTNLGHTVRSSYGMITTDAAQQVGGQGKGHTSLDLLMAALATATSEAARQAAESADLTDVEVKITYVHDKTFTRHIDLRGNLKPSERERIYQAARTSTVEGILGRANIMDL